MTTQNSSILLKRSSVANSVPLAANLQFGELALNYADSVLYSKNAINLVQPITIPPAEKEIYVELHGNDLWDGLTQSRPKRTLKAALNACDAYGCVKLGAGIFYEDNPMVMPQFSTIYGSGTRGTSIIPLNDTKNIIYVTNSCYCTGFAVRDHLSPSIAISYPDVMETGTAQSGTSNTITLASTSVGGVGLEDYYRTMQISITAGTGVGQVRNVVTHNVTSKVVKVDSNWTTIPNSTSQYLVNLPVDYAYEPTKRYSTYITHSPYLYNLTSVTTTGTGFVVDGYLAAGLKSMVSAQFTQYNQGGDGFVVKNLGYAQLVSIYGICCNDAFRAETGGTASMGNCNINFGNRGIVAIGVSPLMLSANLAPSFSYNRDKCTRDTGLIVDALAQDLLFSGNTQSTFAGIQYWNQNNYVGQIQSQLQLTTNTISYVQNIASKVVTNNTSGTRYQIAVSQVTGNSATSSEATTISDDFQVILDIIYNGTSGVTDLIEPNTIVANTNPNNQNAYTLLQSNKAYIQAEAIAYANNAKPYGWPANFTYDHTKCRRDIGLIIDALAFDLQFPSANGNSQSTFAGLQYWAQSGLSIPSGELTATLNALANLKYQMQTVVTTTPEDNYIGSEVDIIINLLNGTTTPNTVTNLIVPNATSATSNANALAAYSAIQSARSTIQSTVLNYVTTTYPGLLDGAQQAKCSRDVGYIIDSICFDLKYNVDNTYAAPSNRQAIQSGIYYLGFGNVSAIPGESVPTTAAYNHLSYLIPYIVTSTPVPTLSRYQISISQNTSSNISSIVEYTRIQNNINTILSIISTGPTASANANIAPISLTANSSTSVANAFALLYSNKNFLKEEVIGYIDSFNYDPTKCARDVGYMVNSVSFDLKYGGNRQAIQSGVYYYGYYSNSAIIGEITQTTAAYNYIKKVAAAVIKGVAIDLPYQTDFDQVITSSIGTNTETAIVNTNISIITNIITNGPSVAANAAPIGLIANTNPAVVNAATLLISNREFIQNEVTAYVDTFFPPQTGYIIAVKDVVPNTDPRTALSANTKPYVGLALNISGDIDTDSANVYRSSLSTRTDDTLGLTSISFQENLITEYAANTKVTFYQRSSLSASGQTFEYVGAGTNALTALPRFGFGVIRKENQVITSGGGVVYYTATDQFGNFQIGSDLTINFNTGTLSGRTFTRSLFAQITPFILALTND